LETFKKICPENPNVVRIGQKSRALYMQTSVSFALADGFNLLATDFFFQILAHPVFKM
jgi:hypothetical protein